MTKRLRVHGTVLRTRPLEEKIALTRQFERYIAPQLETGCLVPMVNRVFPLKMVSEAHRYMESTANSGNIVLTLS